MYWIHKTPLASRPAISGLLGHPDPLPQDPLIGDGYEFRLADGIEAAQALDDRSVALLLTDPPYGISVAYTCEGQVPRRLRKDGRDFIMPKGRFGEWDAPFEA